MGLYLLIIVLLIVCNAVIDWYRIEQLHQTFSVKMYGIKTLIRGGVMLVNAVLAVLLSGDIQFSLWNFVLLTTVQSSVFWFGFDALLNILRGKDWDYVGKTALSDTIFKGNETAQLGVKMLFVFLTVSLFILSITS